MMVKCFSNVSRLLHDLITRAVNKPFCFRFVMHGLEFIMTILQLLLSDRGDSTIVQGP